MNKSRIEIFSDGVFAIVMTLLILEIKVPELPKPFTNTEVWHALLEVAPHVGLYAITFAVLSAIWINHHVLYSWLIKSVDRWLNLMNMGFLMCVAFVPFSASFLAAYPTNQPSTVLYGANLMCIMFLSIGMWKYVRSNPELHLEDGLTPREMKQGAFRMRLSVVSYVLGIACAFIYTPLSLFFYLFPVVFNIVPGLLNLAEKIFRFRLD